jgi:hypothetical protein
MPDRKTGFAIEKNVEDLLGTMGISCFILMFITMV